MSYFKSIQIFQNQENATKANITSDWTSAISAAETTKPAHSGCSKMFKEKESHNQEVWHDTLSAVWGYTLALARPGRVRGKIDVSQSSHYLGKERSFLKKKQQFLRHSILRGIIMWLLLWGTLNKLIESPITVFTKEAETLFLTWFPTYWSSIRAKSNILSHISVKVFLQEQTVFIQQLWR